MIYLVHNTKGNFANADGVGDSKMKNNIILSEIGKLIAVKPEVIIAYLRSVGVKVKDDASSYKLVHLVSNTIPRSKNFTFLLAEEIEGKGRASRMMNGDGDSGSTNSGNSAADWGNAAQSTVGLVAAIADLFGKGKPKPKAKPALNGHTNAIKDIANGGMSNDAKWGWGIAIGLSIIITTGVIVYKSRH